MNIQLISAGIDSLVEKGVVDPNRIGTIGRSYGGYMSAWLVTQTDHFSAGINVSGSVDWFSRHTLSNISYFDKLFLNADPYTSNSIYSMRSPAMHARQCSTPFLSIGGQKDGAVVPTQALQYHHALAENGVKSMAVIYPEEGHGIRSFPAYIDFCYRVVMWFETYMGA